MTPPLTTSGFMLGATMPAGCPILGATIPTAGVQALQADLLADFYGIVVHDTYPAYVGTANQAAVISAVNDLGVRHLRSKIIGGNDTSAAYKAAVTNATGAKWLGPMGTYPSPGIPAVSDANSPESIVGYMGGSAALQTALEAVTGWNEFNLPNTVATWDSDTATDQARLYAAMKAASQSWIRNLPVLGPPLGGKAPADYTKAAAATPALSANCDLADMHLYPSGGAPADATAFPITAQITRVHNVHGLRPIINTETGYHTALGDANGIDEATQLTYEPRLLLEVFSHSVAAGNPNGVQRMYRYELRDEGTDQTNKQNFYGLVRYNDNNATTNRKPAFTALSRLLALANDPGASFTPGKLAFSLGAAPADVRTLLLQKRNGTFLLFLWRDVVSGTATSGSTPGHAVSVTPETVTVAFNNLVTTTLAVPTTGGTYAQSAAAVGFSAQVSLDAGVTCVTVNLTGGTEPAPTGGYGSSAYGTTSYGS